MFFWIRTAWSRWSLSDCSSLLIFIIIIKLVSCLLSFPLFFLQAFPSFFLNKFRSIIYNRLVDHFLLLLKHKSDSNKKSTSVYVCPTTPVTLCRSGVFISTNEIRTTIPIDHCFHLRTTFLTPAGSIQQINHIPVDIKRFYITSAVAVSIFLVATINF